MGGKLAAFQSKGAGMIDRGQYMDVKALRLEGLSIKGIAKQSGLSRNTVRKVLRGEHPLKVRPVARGSVLDPFKSYVKDRFDTYGLSAVRLHAEIVSMGYAGSRQTLRRYLAELRGPLPQATTTLRYETPPGKQAQADWTECGTFELDGKHVKVYAFVMVLSYSRMSFVRFTTSMKMAELIVCHQAAFAYFGGWTQAILYDNMKQVRIGPGRLNEQFADFADHHGFAIKTHRPYRPRTKGKVERYVDYLKDNFLAGRSFAGIDELNTAVLHWLDADANARVHGTTGKIPKEELAAEKLTPLASCPVYRMSQPVKRTVSREAMVHFNGSRYSVPPKLAGQPVWIEAHGGRVTVLTEKDAKSTVAEHREAVKPGQAIVAKEHLAELWRITAAQTALPAGEQAKPRWHLLAAGDVARTSLAVFEELAA
jgi:transposase